MPETPDPRLNDLVATLVRLEESLRHVRDELMRQGERTRINGEGVAELRKRTPPTRQYVDVAAKAAAQAAVLAELGPIKSDVGRLLAVVKPHGRKGMAEEQQDDHRVMWRWIWGGAGVAALLGLIALVLKLGPIWTWLKSFGG